MRYSRIWHVGSVLFRGKRCDSNCDLGSILWHATELSVAQIGWIWRGCVVSTGQGHSPHFPLFTLNFERNVPQSSLRGDISWPARSPDLTPCDFFLWGKLKAKVYAHRPGTTEQLKEAIRQEVAAIPPAKPWTTSVNGFNSVSSITAATWAVIFKSVWKKIASYVLFINKSIFCVPSFIWFLLPFKMWELFLSHSVCQRTSYPMTIIFLECVVTF